ncbi:MAG TPA: polyphenol oxidase family protein [Myxococcales bacterium]|nr:polyphenol oxidase family protein [Myxococcales bacterium]
MPRWLTARVLAEAGVPHAFSTAEAGDMKDPAARAAWLAAVAPGLPLATAKQVHGARAVWGDAAAAPEADALLARRGLAVGVFTADCVPILLADPAAGLAAAVHAGWRGTIAETAVTAVRALVEAGARVAELRAALGPHIRPCCYEVSEELAARFAARFGRAVVTRTPTPHLDLGAANRALLAELGLAAAHVETLAACTACARAPAFFSYRREKELSDRMLRPPASASARRPAEPASSGRQLSIIAPA